MAAAPRRHSTQCAALGPRDPSDIEVQVKDGEMTLSGTVGDRQMKHMIEDVTDAV